MKETKPIVIFGTMSLGSGEKLIKDFYLPELRMYEVLKTYTQHNNLRQ